MWIQDIERAIRYLRGTNNTFRDYVFTKIVPAQDGVAFYTSHFTVVYVHHNGKIEEIKEGDGKND